MPDTERLLSAIDAEESNSYTSDNSSDLSTQCSDNIDRYLGNNKIPVPDGRSAAQDSSVYDTVAQMKPSLARIFANGDDVVRLPPIGPEDEEGSKQESEYLNHVLLRKNNWFQIFDTACTDALTVKRGYLHPYVEKRRQVELEKYQRQTPESLALIMQDQPEVVSQKEYPDPDYQEPPPQPLMDPMGQPVIGESGQPIMMPPPPAPMLYDVEIRRTKVDTSYCVLNLPPERCKVSQTTKTVQLNPGCPYFEFYDFPTISDLRADGYTMLDGSPIMDDIGRGDGTDDTIEDTARNQYAEMQEGDENRADPSMRRVKCRWVWIRHDYDEDGIAELQHVVVVARQVLYREEVNRIPVAVLCPDPLPHRHIGQCPADKAAQTQDINTVFLRQGIDNAQFSNNPAKFGDPSKINLDDALISRPGGFVRTRNGAIFGQDFGVIQTPDILPNVINALQFMEYLNKKRTGVDFSFQGLDANQLSQLQPGTVNQVSGMASQRVEYVARHIANGVKELVSLLHELILKSGHKKDVIKVRGKWVEVNPSTWRARDDFEIAVGYAAGNKDAQMSRLNMIASMQKEAMMGGLRVCTEENVYNTAVELTKSADFPIPDMFWTDPKTLPPPQPPQPDPTVVAIEQLKAQSADNVKRMDVDQKERDSVRDADLAKYQTDVDANVKLTIEQMRAKANAEIKQFEAEHSVGLEHMKGEQTKSIEHEKAALKNQPAMEMAQEVQKLSGALSEAIDSMKGALNVILTAKKSIKRGKGGRAEIVETIGPDGSVIASQKIARGPDNKVLGLE